MNYKYTISAEGNAETDAVRECLEKLGLREIFVEKIVFAKDFVQAQSDEPCKQAIDFWRRMLALESGLNQDLKEKLKRHDESEIKSMRDIAQLICDSCMECDLSEAYTGQILYRIFKSID